MHAPVLHPTQHGVPSGETKEASLAGAGTLTLEMTALSALTGDDRFARAAERAVAALHSKQVAAPLTLRSWCCMQPQQCREIAVLPFITSPLVMLCNRGSAASRCTRLRRARFHSRPAPRVRAAAAVDG
jgi:Glycosyl hydrolase family 47